MTKSEQFVLTFDTTSPLKVECPSVDGEALMEQFVESGVIAFRVNWESRFEVQMAIEDDVIFLCDAMREFSEDQPEHFAHLGDGELEIKARILDGKVILRAVHMPGLEPSKRKEYLFETNVENYRNAWYSLISQLIDQLGFVADR